MGRWEIRDRNRERDRDRDRDKERENGRVRDMNRERDRDRDRDGEKRCNPTWMKVEVDIQEVLIAPRDIVPVHLVMVLDFLQPIGCPDPGQMHEHHSGVDAQHTRVGVSGKPVIPVGCGGGGYGGGGVTGHVGWLVVICLYSWHLVMGAAYTCRVRRRCYGGGGVTGHVGWLVVLCLYSWHLVMANRLYL